MRSFMSKSMRIAAMVLGAVAMQPAWCDQWTTTLTPVTTHIEDDSNAMVVYIATSQAIVNPAGCSATDGYEVADQKLASGALAITMTALTASRSMRLFVSSTVCTGNRPTVLDVELD
jgi:hypothetical protein